MEIDTEEAHGIENLIKNSSFFCQGMGSLRIKKSWMKMKSLGERGRVLK